MVNGFTVYPFINALKILYIYIYTKIVKTNVIFQVNVFCFFHVNKMSLVSTKYVLIKAFNPILLI